MEKEEFAQVVWEARDTMYRMAKSILRSDADCEDAVSQGIVNAFEHLGSLKKPQYAKTWLVRIVMNECYHLAKQNKRQQCYEEDVICIGDWKESYETDWQPEDYSELYTALYELPQTYRVALILYYMEEYSMAEIAKIQDTSVGNVKMRLSRGRKLLKQQFDDSVEEHVVQRKQCEC